MTNDCQIIQLSDQVIMSGKSIELLVQVEFWWQSEHFDE